LYTIEKNNVRKRGYKAIMNPDVLNILLNLVSSTLYSLLCLGEGKIGEFTTGKDIQARLEQENISVGPLFDRTIRSFAEHFAWTYKKGEEVTILFLRSDEVEELLRQFYAIHLAQDDHDLATLRVLFTTLFIQFMKQYPTEVTPREEEQKIIANHLFETLMQASTAALAQAADQGLLSAHEALSTYRHHIIQGQLASIQRRLDFFVTHQTQLDVPA
jgi:hypothetical protein